MAILPTMVNSSWSVICKENKTSKTYWWLYVFTSNGTGTSGTVSWKDEHNGKNGTGTWVIRGSTLTTRWPPSSTVETWKVPIDTDNWTGSCTMNKLSHVMSAKARTYTEADPPAMEIRSEEYKTKFRLDCNLARGRASSSYLQLSSWLKSITAAYSDAYQSHGKFMEDISKTQAIAHDAILGFALAFVGGSIGGFAGAAVKTVMKDAASANDFIVDGIKDLAKYSVRGTSIQIWGAKSKATMPTNPLSWYGNVGAVLDAEFALITSIINSWDQAVADDEPIYEAGNVVNDFNPIQAAEKKITVTIHNQSVIVSALPQIESGQLQKEFELGMLVGWIRTKGSTVTNIPLAREIVVDKLRGEGARLGLDNIDEYLEKYVPLARGYTPLSGQ